MRSRTVATCRRRNQRDALAVDRLASRMCVAHDGMDPPPSTGCVDRVLGWCAVGTYAQLVRRVLQRRVAADEMILLITANECRGRLKRSMEQKANTTVEHAKSLTCS